MVGRSVACALAILAVSVAGCLSGGDEVVLQGDPEDDGSAESDASVNLTAYRFGSGGADRLTVWANGTVPAYHECPQPCYVNLTDITDRIPSDLPVRVVATLEWDDNALSSGIMQIRRGSEAVFYGGGSYVEPQSYTAMATFLRRGATVEIIMEQNFPHATQTSYSLGIEIEWNATKVLNVVPVAFDARTDEVIAISADGENAVSAIVYDSAGAPVARWSEPGPVDFTAPVSGRYVLLPRQDGGNLTLKANGSAPSALVPMRYETQQSEMQPYAAAPAAPHSWTFTVDYIPSRVGAFVIFPRSLETGQARPHLTIESPAGLVVDWTPECSGVCLFPFGTIQGLSERGHPDLVPGEYTVTYTPTAAEASVAYHLADRVVAV